MSYPSPLEPPDFVVVAPRHLEEVRTWGEHPYCECDSSQCVERLPIDAWVHAGVPGQFVVLPGHEEPGERIVRFDGWVVVEGDV